MKCRYFCVFISIVFLFSCNTLPKKTITEKKNTANDDSIKVKYQLVTYCSGIPIELNQPGSKDENVFVTDNTGKISILKKDSLEAKPFFNIYDKIGKQPKNSRVGMIFSVAFSPQYSTDRKFYVCYNAPSKVNTENAKLVVSEFTASKTNPNLADMNSEHRVIEFKGRTVQDNGSQMIFGPDGYLYISLGDDNAKDTSYHYHSQDLKYLNGKLLRIDVSKTPYAIPADNPFVGVKNARPEIWAYGFRKLWRYSFDPLTHQIFGGDVGEDKEEEIDIVTKGSNYGWPIKEGDSVFEKNNSNSDSNFTAPIFEYNHKVGICVIGGSFYNGDEIRALKNKYVFADWKGGIFALSKNKDQKWASESLKIINKSAEDFFICGCIIDGNNQIFLLGYLVGKDGGKGVIYKLKKDNQ
ncbi:MAG: PQQ-dependent sugar dehydrogenase [Ginsengibacter sp.]